MLDAINKSLDKRLIDRKAALSTNRHSMASGQYFLTSPLHGGHNTGIRMSESVMAARDTANCTPINNALNSIVSKGQESSRQLMFDCDTKHELTRRSAEKKKELQLHEIQMYGEKTTAQN
jgi:hypothetical protein